MPTSTRQIAPFSMKIFGKFAAAQRADVGIGPYNPVNRIATEIEAAFIFSEKPYDSKNAAAVKMTDS